MESQQARLSQALEHVRPGSAQDYRQCWTEPRWWVSRRRVSIAETLAGGACQRLEFAGGDVADDG